jgi:hypothetical protein
MSATSSLRESGAINGVGETKYLRGTDRTALSFQRQASLTANRDAGMKPSDIDGLIPYGINASSLSVGMPVGLGFEVATDTLTLPVFEPA